MNTCTHTIIVPMKVINHSGELKPKIGTPKMSFQFKLDHRLCCLFNIIKILIIGPGYPYIILLHFVSRAMSKGLRQFV